MKLREMESQMGVATGLVHSISVLRDRAVATITEVCRTCSRLRTTCACEESQYNSAVVNRGVHGLDRIYKCN